MLSLPNLKIIREIQNKADIVAVISNFIKLNRRGNNYIGLCPFHPDKNPSLVVSPKKRIFKCFVCNAKGNVFGFVQQYQKIPFMEAVRVVAKLIGYDDAKLTFVSSDTYLDPKVRRLLDLNKQVGLWYEGFLRNPENKDKLMYLHQRGLDNAIIKEFGFGYAPRQNDLIYRMATNANGIFGNTRSKELIWSDKELLDVGLININQNGTIFDFFTDRIMIPIHDNNGYLAGFSGRVLKNVEPKYLNTGETKLFSKSNILFNYYKAKQFVDDKIIIVEGFMDAITYVRAGHKNVVATMGIALTDEHLTALHFFNKLNVVILSFDNDAAGVMATIANGQKLMENDFNVYVVAPYDKNIKDVDELSQRNGKEAIQNILDERIDFATFMINTEFASKKPLDEIQKSVNKIISQMINFGSNSLLLRQKHLKLLSEKSGLAFEDLKSKFEYDFTQINQLSQNQKIYSKYMPTKPDNDVGLPKTFIETEEIIKEKENNNIVSGKFYDALVEEQLALKKRLSQGYDKLILAIMNNSDKSFNFLKDLNIRQTDYEFIEQEYIFKSIDYMSIKGDKPDEKKLGEFLVEQSKGDNAIANNYKKAYAYLQRLIEKPIYLNFEKKLLSDKYEERLKIVNDIKAQKYELIMKSKTLEMWQLKKQDNTKNKNKINKLLSDISDIKQNFRQWQKQSKITKG